MTERADRPAMTAALVAGVLGLTSAGVSTYWALGGEGLLDTVGGEIERWAREGDPATVWILLLIAALKTVVAAAAPILVGVGGDRSGWMIGRVPRTLGWIAAGTLTVYGGVLTASGLLVEAGVVEASDDADSKALAWHAYFWDPWFAIWGVAFALALWRSRPAVGPR